MWYLYCWGHVRTWFMQISIVHFHLFKIVIVTHLGSNMRRIILEIHSVDFTLSKGHRIAISNSLWTPTGLLHCNYRYKDTCKKIYYLAFTLQCNSISCQSLHVFHFFHFIFFLKKILNKFLSLIENSKLENNAPKLENPQIKYIVGHSKGGKKTSIILANL